MERSEDIDQLATALAKAQGTMHCASKDGNNPFLKSRYATLGAIWDACREPLSANCLAVSQDSIVTDEGVTITTMLMHASGQYLQNALTLPSKARDPQAIGATITYARRYALAAMVGVAPEDDEARLNAERSSQPQVTHEQLLEINRLTGLVGDNEAIVRATLSRVYQAASLRQLTADQADSWLADLRQRLAAAGLVVAAELLHTPPVGSAPAAPAGGTPATLQDALAAEQAAGSGTGSQNGHVNGYDALRNLIDVRDSFFSLRGVGDPDTAAGRSDREVAWAAILARRGLTPISVLTAEQTSELTETLERRVAELAEQRRASGITCASKEAPAMLPASKS